MRAMSSALDSPRGNPFSASSMADWSTCSKLIVPQRSSIKYQASTTPGKPPESNPSLSGIFPPLFFSYHSMVASLGARGSALTEYTFFSRATYTSATASLPSPLSAKSVIPKTAWPATAASKALPPASRILRAASVACALIDDTAATRPRITGRIV